MTSGVATIPKEQRGAHRRWEYWPAQAFYFPMYLWGPLLALRSGHPAFFTAANPGIHTGGFGFESKYATTLKIPAPYRPKTTLARATDDFPTVLGKIQRAGIAFPLIAKPDLGFRGFLVQKIDDETALQAYLKKFPTDFIVQELIWRAGEFGVLYHRFPGQQHGKITSVTLKEFLAVTGNGYHTVLELVQQDPRAARQLDRLYDTHATLLHTIPAAGERVPLGIIGNHSKGTRFINGNHLIDNYLEKTFDRIADQIPGFCYGRFDIKCDSWEALRRGEGIIILEVNGVCAEPTHIYDPEHISYFGAIRTILQHWDIIAQLSRANQRRGARCIPTFEMIRIIREGLRKVKRLKAIAAQE
ncbi:MAG TPA: hypothetical protein PKC76_16255 [Saprospiraceae bacterium]|nr:hypothetical protein [Saprospiraceae bacterium]HMP25685.1 hypothetical protein [Saprospiraceae bacterium]